MAGQDPGGDGGPMDIALELASAVLDLNNAYATELSLLDAGDLGALLHDAFYARCIGTVDAFLLALDQEHPSYKSPNYLWFRAWHTRFVYVDRVAVAIAARGQGHAKRLYADLIEHARAAGHDAIVCEVNSDPPNPASDAFHAALGFRVIGIATIHGGAKTVRYLMLQILSTRPSCDADAPAQL